MGALKIAVSLGLSQIYILFLMTIVLVGICPSSVCADEPPVECEPEWLPVEAGVPGLQGFVTTSIAWDSDGNGPQEPQLVVGGFKLASGSKSTDGYTSLGGAVLWSGSEWRPLAKMIEVKVFAVFNGALIAAGRDVDGTNSIFQWNGETWQTLDATLVGMASSLIVYDGRLVAAGVFTIGSNPEQASVAAWDGQGWTSLQSYADGENRAARLTVWNNLLVAVGHFAVEGQADDFAVRAWDGDTWFPLGGIFALSTTTAVGTYQGKLYVAGKYTIQTETDKKRVYTAVWDGVNWQAWPVPMLDVYAITIHNNELYVGGRSSTRFNHLVRWDGSDWWRVGTDTVYGVGCGFLSARATTITTVQSTLYIGGHFGCAGETPAWNIASWDGSEWLPLRIGLGGDMNGGFPLYVHNDDLYSVGMDDYLDKRIARWDGAAWHTLLRQPNLAVGERAMASFQYQLAVGGQLVFDGQTFPLALWDGSVWHPTQLCAPQYTAGYVAPKTMVEYQNALVIAGNGPVVQWDGSSCEPISPPLDEVRRAIVYHNELVIVGDLEDVLGPGMTTSARWDGTAWRSFPVAFGDGRSLTIYNGLLVSGSQTWDGESVANLGDMPLQYVVDLAVYRGELIAGRSSPAQPPYLLRWDGQTWMPLGNDVNSPVNSLAVYQDQLIVTGGSLTQVGGSPLDGGTWADGWAVWGCPPAPEPPACPADFNGVNGVTVQDIFDFLTAWLAGSPSADFNGVNGVTIQDIFDFLTAWLVGC